MDGTVWHRTGDAGWLDAVGRLWLLGRCTAKIPGKDGTLWPFAVECAAMNCPGVARAALAEVAGRRILAVQSIASSPDPTAAVREQLAWAHLDEILPVPAIPVDKRHNAKVDYPALRAMLTSRK